MFIFLHDTALCVITKALHSLFTWMDISPVLYFTWISCSQFFCSSIHVVGVFPKWSRTFIKFSEFTEFRDLINHWSINSVQYKDPVSHMCLACTVVESWSLTWEVVGSTPFTVMASNFVTQFSKFSENI